MILALVFLCLSGEGLNIRVIFNIHVFVCFYQGGITGAWPSLGEGGVGLDTEFREMGVLVQCCTLGGWGAANRVKIRFDDTNNTVSFIMVLWCG